MTTYYAVCNVYGPISKRIEAETIESAICFFESANSRNWIDEAATDIEDDLDIAGAQMSQSDFADLLRSCGMKEVYDLSGNNILNDWALWVFDEADLSED